MRVLFTKSLKQISNKLVNVVHLLEERESLNVPRNASVSIQNQKLVIQMSPNVSLVKKQNQNVVQLENVSLSTNLSRLSSNLVERVSNRNGDVLPRLFVSTMSANVNPRDVVGLELFLLVDKELFALGEKTERLARNVSSVARKRLSVLEKSANKLLVSVHLLDHGDNLENMLSASMFHSRLSRRDSVQQLF